MSICNMKKLLEIAKNENKAIGAFSVGNMEMIIGAMKASEEKNVPIILQIAEARLKHSPLEYIGPMMVNSAKNAKTEICVHFDHGTTFENIEKALNMGFSSVMFDGSLYNLNENIEKTNYVLEIAKKYDASVEAELGIVGGNEGGNVDHNICYTNPDEVKQFLKHCSVDALAVAIGNSHGNYKKEPNLRFDILKEIFEEISVPLVLHGGTGISFSDFRKAINNGIRKINIATSSFDALTYSAKEYFEQESNFNYFSLNEMIVNGVYENIKKHIEVFENKELI